MPYVNVRDLPEVLSSALSTCSYAKPNVQILIKEKESVQGAGMQGYRSFAMIVNMSTGESKQLQGSWGGSNPFNPTNVVDNNDQVYVIPKDMAIILGFTGGSSGITHATITFSPHNILPILTCAPDVSNEEQKLLAIMRGYKPAYRKPYLDAKKELVNSLVERGYIKRASNGALSLTVSGKNACEGVNVSI
jgi:hypothetical protein